MTTGGAIAAPTGLPATAAAGSAAGPSQATMQAARAFAPTTAGAGDDAAMAASQALDLAAPVTARTAHALLVTDRIPKLLGKAGAEALGLLAVAGATLAWACDNTLSRRLADHDPDRVVLGKGLLGASISAGVALALGEPMPAIGALTGLLACGMLGYGLSLRFYLLAQRRLGSARTGSVFATAPFIGAGVAWMLGEPLGGWASLAAVLLMAFGIYLHLTEHRTEPAAVPSAASEPS